MGQVRDPRHLDFDGNSNLALDLLGAAARPLRNDLHVVIGDVGVGLDGQAAEGNNAPGGQHYHAAQYQPAAFQREIDQRSNQFGKPLRSKGKDTNPGSIQQELTVAFGGSRGIYVPELSGQWIGLRAWALPRIDTRPGLKPNRVRRGLMA